MTIKRRFFAGAGGAGPSVPSAGDGAVYPTQDPNTGEPLKNSAPRDPGRLSTVGGLDSEVSRNRGDVQAYKETRAAVVGEKPGQSAGFALPTGDANGDHSDRFHTHQ